MRDRVWLDRVRESRCLVTGKRGSAVETVDPAHISTAGTGVKSADNEVIPLLHSVHLQCHNDGEAVTLQYYLVECPVTASMIADAYHIHLERRGLNADMPLFNMPLASWNSTDFSLALRAYARQEYKLWQHDLPPFATAGL